MEELHGNCIILKQMRYCKVVLHYSICVSVPLFIDLSVPPTKEMAVPKIVHSTEAMLSNYYTNIRTAIRRQT